MDRRTDAQLFVDFEAVRLSERVVEALSAEVVVASLLCPHQQGLSSEYTPSQNLVVKVGFAAYVALPSLELGFEVGTVSAALGGTKPAKVVAAHFVREANALPAAS